MQLNHKRVRMIAALLSSTQIASLAGLSIAVGAFALPGRASAQTAAAPFVSANRYDGMQRLVGTIAPDPDDSGPLHYAATRNTYNAAGWLMKVETGELSSWKPDSIAPNNWGSSFSVLRVTDISYDAMGRKTQEIVSSPTGSDRTATQFAYDDVGRPTCTAVRMNPAEFNALPASACTGGTTTGANGPDRITKNVYETTGRLAQVRRAVGTSLEQAYVTYAYTGNGQKSDVIDAGGNRAHMTFDGFDRQLQWQFPSSTKPTSYNGVDQTNALSSAGAVNTGDYEAYGYDLNGNRTSLRKRDGRTFTFGFDALDRMSSKIVPDNCMSGYICTQPVLSATRDVYYGYDNRGLQRFARFDSVTGADEVQDTYDAAGRHASTLTSMAGSPRSLSYTYDSDGNRQQVLFPDTSFNYSFDGMDRMNGASVGSGGAIISMTYNPRTLPDTITRGPGSTTYGYDSISRLSSQGDRVAGGAMIVTAGLSYNPASQIVTRSRDTNVLAFADYANSSKAYAADGLNRYTSVAGVGVTYDSNGNLLTDGSNTYAYDAENRLLSVSGSKSGTLTYDPLGRLYQTTGASGTTQFLYDGDRLTAEYGAAGNLLRRYLHGTSDDTPLVAFEGSGVSPAAQQFLHPDHQGSITLIGDTSGYTLATNRYDEYGLPAAGNAGRFQFTGQAWLGDSALYYYKARFYHPTLGRFLQTDPIGYRDQSNLYVYVANDPLNTRDPNGLYVCDSEETCKVASAAFRAAERLAQTYGPVSREGMAIRSAISSFGKEGFNNGVLIRNSSVDSPSVANTQAPSLYDRVMNSAKVIVNWDLDKAIAGGRSTVRMVSDIVHEGAHVRLGLEGSFGWNTGHELYERELEAWTAGLAVRHAAGVDMTLSPAQAALSQCRLIAGPNECP